MKPGSVRHPPVVVGIGELLWDLLPDGRKLGGAPANFAYHARSLGALGHAVSCVGDDPDGRDLLDLLSKQGLGIDYIAVTPAYPTGTVSVRLDQKGIPKYDIHENVAWDHIPFLPEQTTLARAADAVCFGTLAQRSADSRETIRSFLRSARQDSLRVFDVNLRGCYYDETIIRESLELADVLKLSDEELPVVAEVSSLVGDCKTLLNRLLKQFSLRCVALTRGPEGSLLVTPEQTAQHKADLPGAMVDTVGAGDSFTAALVLGLLRRAPLDEICREANELAAYVCTQNGAMPSLPSNLRYGDNG